jgi:uncharacterized cysteine cluster protein YcgN (CxxCxxCC family)
LSTLDRGEWEALCDGCGRCCLHKLEDDETGELYPTNVACRLLDRRKLASLDWLPETGAYRLRAAGKPLPEWHYLISGSRETVHEAGQSTRGWTVNEDDAGDLEWHVVEREL